MSLKTARSFRQSASSLTSIAGKPAPTGIFIDRNYRVKPVIHCRSQPAGDEPENSAFIQIERFAL
jgi:hypothetical protein